MERKPGCCAQWVLELVSVRETNTVEPSPLTLDVALDFALCFAFDLALDAFEPAGERVSSPAGRPACSAIGERISSPAGRSTGYENTVLAVNTRQKMVQRRVKECMVGCCAEDSRSVRVKLAYTKENTILICSHICCGETNPCSQHFVVALVSVWVYLLCIGHVHGMIAQRWLYNKRVCYGHQHGVFSLGDMSNRISGVVHDTILV